MKKPVYAMGIALMMLTGVAQAGLITFDFENSANILNAGGTGELYSGPDSNTFGSGVTVSALTLTEAVAAQFSRIDTVGGSTHAAVQGRNNSFPQVSFTVNIPAGVVVDLETLSFDHVANRAGTAITNYTWTLDPAGASASTLTNTTTHDGTTDFQTLSSESLTLSGLTGLTNTTATFTFTLSSDFTTSFNNTSQGLDNIILGGTVIPEPTNVGLLVVGLVFLLLIRRKNRKLSLSH